MDVTDTSAEAQIVANRAQAKLGGAGRVAAAVEMAEIARTVACDGIRHRNPQLDDDGVRRAWLQQLYGDELTARLFGEA